MEIVVAVWEELDEREMEIARAQEATKNGRWGAAGAESPVTCSLPEPLE
jgi:hypothetical protein